MHYCKLCVSMILLLCTGLSQVGLHVSWKMTINSKALQVTLAKTQSCSQAAVIWHNVGLHCHLPCHIYISACCIEALEIMDFRWWPKKCFLTLAPSVYLQKYPVFHKGSWDDIYYLQLAHLFAVIFTPFSHRYLLFVLILFYLLLCKDSSETAHLL